MSRPDRAYKCGEEIIHVYHDEDGQNPRENDCVSVMWFFHNRYWNLGDKKDVKADDFSGWREMARHLKNEEGASLICVVTMYEHSGRALSLGPTITVPENEEDDKERIDVGGDRWDSGILGFMWTTPEKVAETLGSDATEEKIRHAFEVELEEYNQWIEGDCWGYKEVKDGEEDDDNSRWGFLGYDDKASGLLNEAFGANADKAVEVKAIAHTTTVWTHKEGR